MKKGIFLPLVVAILAAIVYGVIVNSAQSKLTTYFIIVTSMPK